MPLRLLEPVLHVNYSAQSWHEPPHRERGGEAMVRLAEMPTLVRCIALGMWLV